MLFSKPKIISLDGTDVDELFVFKTVIKPDKKTFIEVDDNHYAVLLKNGIYINTLTSGKYPVLEKKEKPAGEVEIIFMSKTSEVAIKWGVPTRFEMRDPKTDVAVKVGGRGTFTLHVGDPRKTYLDLIATDKIGSVEQVKEKLRRRIVDVIQSYVAKAMGENHLTYAELKDGAQLAELIKPSIAEVVRKDYGLILSDFTVEAIVIDDEDIHKIESALSENNG